MDSGVEDISSSDSDDRPRSERLADLPASVRLERRAAAARDEEQRSRRRRRLAAAAAASSGNALPPQQDIRYHFGRRPRGETDGQWAAVLRQRRAREAAGASASAAAAVPAGADGLILLCDVPYPMERVRLPGKRSAGGGGGSGESG
jgi:hypothetical protein